MYTDQDIANLVARVQQLEMQAASRQAVGMPNIKMLSPNFLTRAFAVWGHNFVASLLIGIAISCVMTVIGLILGAAVGATALDWMNQLIGSIPK
ncbi:MAG: hypothetical protein CVU42_05645 [Chloroflexi bacterium HGW-Chloroflexi-4]|jgi:hypothetical protein|nr:MAG: hypothetical protein CVU45_02420 [Chloroflexi bacterium HGW-Chloroflexi-7]PKO00224.1 MAG: hypothetical protein CVU42_05645 [Chloroflexi bacterium HGW-Chloroflexi-4]